MSPGHRDAAGSGSSGSGSARSDSGSAGSGKPRPDLGDAVTAPYWEAARRGELALPRCDACGLVFAYPRRFCPGCWSPEHTWQTMAGCGLLWSFTEVHVAFYDDTWADDIPYVVAVVELAEGPRLMANLVDPDPHRLHIGARVEATFVDRGDDLTLPVFRLAP